MTTTPSFEDVPATDRSEVTALLDPGPAVALAGLLDLEHEVVSDGTLPPLWHWVYLLERPPASRIGADGHPVTGVPAPPGKGLKRMFAGGRVDTLRPVRLSTEARRRTWVTGERVVEGRSGTLRFVSVRTEVSQDGQVAIREDNDIVYRRAGSPTLVPVGSLAAPPPPVDGPAVRLVADEVALMRFSALTYNAHRIHYDPGWCGVEGYDGLVVHGPLQALLMGEHVRRHGGGLLGRRFDYRLVGPAVGTQVLTAVADPGGTKGELALLDVHGRTTATASHSAVEPVV
ncbi:mesaconyl-C4 CoA hydratase [Janibacter sp. GS2]|uniref:mesaconyl-C4 CoA hydratase n=1 Tax=Janibacter sp. GS2 TaxID=3442646 RepID=UPI003EC01A4C